MGVMVLMAREPWCGAWHTTGPRCSQGARVDSNRAVQKGQLIVIRIPEKGLSGGSSWLENAPQHKPDPPAPALRRSPGSRHKGAVRAGARAGPQPRADAHRYGTPAGAHVAGGARAHTRPSVRLGPALQPGNIYGTGHSWAVFNRLVGGRMKEPTLEPQPGARLEKRQPGHWVSPGQSIAR